MNNKSPLKSLIVYLQHCLKTDSWFREIDSAIRQLVRLHHGDEIPASEITVMQLVLE
jgi:hypothetical protein